AATEARQPRITTATTDYKQQQQKKRKISPYIAPFLNSTSPLTIIPAVFERSETIALFLDIKLTNKLTENFYKILHAAY
ncbi:hypothetical protein BX616_006804, partial [Lobosporangium transversale]